MEQNNTEIVVTPYEEIKISRKRPLSGEFAKSISFQNTYDVEKDKCYPHFYHLPYGTMAFAKLKSGVIAQAMCVGFELKKMPSPNNYHRIITKWKVASLGEICETYGTREGVLHRGGEFIGNLFTNLTDAKCKQICSTHYVSFPKVIKANLYGMLTKAYSFYGFNDCNLKFITAWKEWRINAYSTNNCVEKKEIPMMFGYGKDGYYMYLQTIIDKECYFSKEKATKVVMDDQSVKVLTFDDMEKDAHGDEDDKVTISVTISKKKLAKLKAIGVEIN